MLLADGTSTPIADIVIGDIVFAHDPETGQAGAREVTATWPHTDTLVEFEVGNATVTTTEDHEFWNVTDQAWQETQHIDAGDYLLTADGHTVEAGNLLWDTAHHAPAFDLTIDEIHAYHVTAGDEQVLVHNTDCKPFAGRPTGLTYSGSDGGPGSWTEIGRGDSGLDYQFEITGAPQRTDIGTGTRVVTEYEVNGVNFDGWDRDRGVLLDSKDWNNFPSDLENPPQFLIDEEIRIARDQVSAADGNPVEWVLPNAERAEFWTDVLDSTEPEILGLSIRLS